MTTLTTLYRLLGTAALIATLSACATKPTVPTAAAPAKLQDMLTKASEAASAGQKETAVTLWKEATAAHPADKTAWGHIAKTKFDAAQYGEAIVNAQEVLVRDPNDKQASSIIATSGLRLATRALADLSRQNGLAGSLQKESMELARVLRESLGNDVLFTSPPTDKIVYKDKEREPKPKVRSSDTPKPPKPKADDCKAGDPFCMLK
jgi:predicted Zn-dependent protease